jgi:hypothetical protein
MMGDSSHFQHLLNAFLDFLHVTEDGFNIVGPNGRTKESLLFE